MPRTGLPRGRQPPDRHAAVSETRCESQGKASTPSGNPLCEVAYLRFASVYQAWESLEGFGVTPSSTSYVYVSPTTQLGHRPSPDRSTTHEQHHP